MRGSGNTGSMTRKKTSNREKGRVGGGGVIRQIAQGPGMHRTWKLLYYVGFLGLVISGTVLKIISYTLTHP